MICCVIKQTVYIKHAESGVCFCLNIVYSEEKDWAYNATMPSPGGVCFHKTSM